MKIIKNKNQYFSYLQKQFSKFAVVLVVVSMLFSTLGINQTSAYFTSSATVSGNTFTAGTLDIALNSENSVDFGLMYPGDNNNSVSVDISNTGTLDSQYLFKTIPTGSDNSACDYITVTATNSVNIYTGNISNFTSVAENTINKTWNFDLKVNNSAPASVWGKTCSFKWVYTAWQTNLPNASTGFTSIKEKSGAINIGKAVVMNEILPNPEGLDTQHGLQGEWVELYNNSNTSINLNGWKIKDLAGNTKIISSLNTLNGRTMIGTKGSYLEWVVVFMNDDIFNNDGDTVYFTDQLDNPIDQYSYISSSTDDNSDSNSTGGGSNSNSRGSETAGNEGKSYARLPADGTGDWVDPIPTPGMPNELTEEIIPKEIIETEEPVVIEEVKSDTATETENAIVPEVIAEIPPATEPEEVITEESKVVETPISEVIEPVVTELTPVISETEAILEPDPVVEVPAIEPAPIE